MFGFLKDKLKGAINLFKKKVDEEVPDEKVEIETAKLEEAEAKKPAQAKSATSKPAPISKKTDYKKEESKRGSGESTRIKEVKKKDGESDSDNMIGKGSKKDQKKDPKEHISKSKSEELHETHLDAKGDTKAGQRSAKISSEEEEGNAMATAGDDSDDDSAENSDVDSADYDDSAEVDSNTKKDSETDIVKEARSHKIDEKQTSISEGIALNTDELISEAGDEETQEQIISKPDVSQEVSSKPKKKGFFGRLMDTFSGKKDEDSDIDKFNEELERSDDEEQQSEASDVIISKSSKITPELDSEIQKLEEETLEQEKLEKQIESVDEETPKDVKKEMESVLAESDDSAAVSDMMERKDTRDSLDRLKEDAIEEELIEDQLRDELVTEKVYEKVKQDSGSAADGKSDEDMGEIEGVIGGELDVHSKELKQEKADEKQQKKDDFERRYSEQAEKKGFFQRFTETFTTKKITDEKFDEMFWDIEVAMLENNVAVEVIEKIKADLKENIVGKALPKNDIEKIILETLKDSIDSLFDQENIDVMARIKAKMKEGKPYVICFVGINGSGKTTTIAKFAHLLKTKDISSVIAAADTFRAAAIDQLEEHAERLGIKLVRHDYNADPAAVAFDAIKHAESKNKNVVLIDTAGRLHSNQNLMEELHKIVRVAKPDLTVFVGESITGNDCIEQAREFDKMVKIDGIILSKADIDQKGGAAISISYVLKKPILYFGVGQNYEDLRPFSIDFINENLNLGSEEN